ncbi:hypothetical protein [Thalassotalea marina]|uniref:Uncharacterized protein n=1 Tax=Thalassotalea marina TaxID=1673741 RepID=A0A919EPH7_9GAMM|nr:hypothetical protein [Thalassotalea marina]GHG04071.1 hypothetical protein GCM10017161_36860 [Thalassotalea marina]
MKQLKTSTKKFIFANIKHNASTSSYPTRKLADGENPIDNTTRKVEHLSEKASSGS